MTKEAYFRQVYAQILTRISYHLASRYLTLIIQHYVYIILGLG